MNGLKRSVSELEVIIRAAGELSSKVELMICPPATLISAFASLVEGGGIEIGGQDCHPEPNGAHTGDLSAEMLADAGAKAVILGHSERRTDHHETDGEVRAKVLAARRAGLTAIVCVGETQAQRQNGEAFAVVRRQLAGSLPDNMQAADLVVAYEPVWAIGSGLTPTPADIAETHDAIRALLVGRFSAEGEKIRTLYGGSVKPVNARELLAISNVDGALVGGASLKAQDFLAIAAAYR